MYKRILIATDGSELSDRAIAHGVELAKAVGASVVGIHASPSFRIYAGSVADITNTLEREYRDAAEASAKTHLAKIEKAAAAADVPCEVHYKYGDPIHQTILNALGDYDCDLAVMASHGRGSVGSLLLGSVTQKVLAHGDRPVLVVR